MNDNEIEKIQTVDVNVTAESLDAHVECLRQNGYSVSKTTSNFLWYAICFMAGVVAMGKFLHG